MKIFLIAVLLVLSSCSWFKNLIYNESDNVKLVRTTLGHYNAFEEKSYFTMFDQNVNYFATNGLGVTRYASGIEEYRARVSHTIRNKNTKVEVLDLYQVGPWVFVHQKTTLPNVVLESSVGYRIVGTRIADIMIIGERKMD